METKTNLNVVKIGGDIVDDPHLLNEFYKQISQIDTPIVIVHGGGNKASELQELLGQKPIKIDGRRVTDQASLDVVTMVYAGLLNKKVVAGLQAIGKNAIGLSGADGNSIIASKRAIGAIDYGFVGDIEEVSATLIIDFITKGLVPVFCPITHSGNGQLLNTNADTIAASIAGALAKYYNVTLNYCFTRSGVLYEVNDGNSVIQHMDQTKYQNLKNEGIITEGMIPKLQNAFAALNAGINSVRLGKLEMLSNKQVLHTTIKL